MRTKTLITLAAIFIIVATAIAIQAQGIRELKGDFPVASSAQALEKFISYIMDHDMVAANKLLATGRVYWLAAGTEVYIVETNRSKSMVKVRLKGKLEEVWTLMNQVNGYPYIFGY